MKDPMKVFVLADTKGDDLVYRLVADGPSQQLSPLFTLKNDAWRIGYNPYLMYGESIREHYKLADLLTVEVRVSQLTSGKLVD